MAGTKTRAAGRSGFPLPTDETFAAEVAGFRTEARSLIRRLDAGKFSAKAWGDGLADVLERAHSRAAYLGRLLAGDFAPFEADDVRLGQIGMDVDAEFLQNFIDDLDNGRYDDNGLLDIRKIEHRVELYLHKLRGTANEVFVLASSVDAMFAWEMVAEEHCGTCPQRAAKNPYRAEQINFHPGDGSTECLTNCGCVWVRIDDGCIGFSRLAVQA